MSPPAGPAFGLMQKGRALQRALAFFLHFLRGGGADNGEGDRDDPAHTVAELEARLQQAGLGILDAADRVEAMKAPGKLGDVLVHAAGVVVARGKADLVRQGGELLDKLLLRLVGELIRVRMGGHGMALGGEVYDQRTDARMGVLDIVNRVFVVLALGKLRSKSTADSGRELKK